MVVQFTRKCTSLSLLKPLQGKEKNLEFPVAPVNAFRREVKGQEATQDLQAR